MSTNLNKLFNNCSLIENIDGMFMNCSNFSSSIPANIFKNMSKLKSAKNTFAGTNVSLTQTSTDSLFEETPLLSNVSGLFKGVKYLPNVISYKTFDKINKNLTDTSYMFAQTNIETIEEGVVNTYNGYLYLSEKDGTLVPSFSEENVSCFTLARLEEDTCYLKVDSIHYVNVDKDFKLSLTDDVEDAAIFNVTELNGLTQFSFTNIDDEEFQTTRYISVLSDLKGISVSMISSSTTAFQVEDTVNVVLELAKYELDGHGLLCGCTNLTSTKQMFACCDKLSGRVPADIFYSATSNTQYQKLTDISGMFDTCSSLCSIEGSQVTSDVANTSVIYSVDANDSRTMLVPRNWLSLCPNIVYANALFRHVGNKSTEDNKRANLAVPMSLFDSCRNIVTAANMFDRCVVISGTDFTRAFLSKSLNTLTDVSYFLCYCPVSSISSDNNTKKDLLFTGLNGGANNTIKNVNYAFYGTSFEKSCYVPTSSNLPKSNITSYVYTYGPTKDYYNNKIQNSVSLTFSNDNSTIQTNGKLDKVTLPSYVVVYKDYD